MKTDLYRLAKAGQTQIVRLQRYHRADFTSLIAKLQAVPGVKQVGLMLPTVKLLKQNAAQWQNILPKVKEVLEEEGFTETKQ